MAIANLHETLLSYKMRQNELNLQIAEWQTQKTLATYSQADLQSLLSSEKHEVRDYFKGLYENDEELQEQYLDYTEIPDFEEEIDKITAKFQEQLEELTAWETALDAQITTASTELEEIEGYKKSFESMLQANISEDFEIGIK